MKKLILAATAGLVLSGCQMTPESDSNIADADFANMSCEQIKQTFNDYKDQMDNVDTGASLLSTVGVDAGTSEAKQLMREGYTQAKKVADPVMKAKSCKFSV
ncbi:lipoprotein [Echinimonas agarilytica]|uniref:Type IV secretion system putative lipoprotein virB7 n=1 Tax=Echinimonas agarilytica TaxID=1215918 RepID=A0AA41W700_9GAMM|nr:lipoprotein [Echinimonas agarilytica]MCM2680202.1 lipoprotein [Echinimonas agarilytica]